MEKIVSFLAERSDTYHAIHGPRLIPWSNVDVPLWQTNYLAASPAYRNEHCADYGNHFLFEHRA